MRTWSLPPQANALFRKNGMQQRRAWVQTLVIVALPIVFCILLFILQRLLNKALDTPENRVRACHGLECLFDVPGTHWWEDSQHAWRRSRLPL